MDGGVKVWQLGFQLTSQQAGFGFVLYLFNFHLLSAFVPWFAELRGWGTLFAHMAFGTVAARQGFSLLDAVAMSAIVFSGVAQIIVVDAWPRELTVASVSAIAAVTAVICSRFLLIGAAMRPLLSRLPPAQV